MLTIILPTIISIFSIFPGHLTSRVIDQTGEPISFAQIKADDVEVYADVNGYFQIHTDSDSITISSLSYKTSTVCTKSCSSNITLKDLHPSRVIVMK